MALNFLSGNDLFLTIVYVLWCSRIWEINSNLIFCVFVVKHIIHWSSFLFLILITSLLPVVFSILQLLKCILWWRSSPTLYPISHSQSNYCLTKMSAKTMLYQASRWYFSPGIPDGFLCFYNFKQDIHFP